MRLYEFEAKKVFSSNGVPTPNGFLAKTSQSAREAAAILAVPVAVKAQVPIAGRGKSGGILFAKTPEEAEEVAKRLLTISVKDIPVKGVLVEEKMTIKKELYFGITVDRINRCYVAVGSDIGGMEIEEVAQKMPNRIFKQIINPRAGFREFNAIQFAKLMGYGERKMIELADLLVKIYNVAVDCDAILAESNPLVENEEGKFVCVDARIVLDDNALFRHEKFRLERLNDQRELRNVEFEALKFGLEYVELEGNIGTVGNGAGLVMATLDMINLFGGQPANFLDIGGGASPERIEKALKIVLSNPKVQVLFLNILGGITLCDDVAKGLVQARENLKTSKPIVVRLVGTNEEEGKKILRTAGIQVFESMEKAAQKVVEFAEKGDVKIGYTC